MSGHSKWSTIKHKKGAADAKRGALFTKLGNNISLAVKQGGSDPDTNFSLKLAIDKARSANLPKDNIERAIQRGAGELDGGPLEEIVYEGFGPNQTAIIIEALTDNKNRTASEIKNIFNKYGGSLAGPGSVMWQFKKIGQLTIDKKTIAAQLSDFELKLIDLGASDIQMCNQNLIIYCPPDKLQIIKENLDQQNIATDSAEIIYLANEPKSISTEAQEKIENFFSNLDDNPDVTNFYTNLK